MHKRYILKTKTHILLFLFFRFDEIITISWNNDCHKSSINLIHIQSYRFNVRLFRGIEYVMLELTHVHVLFRNLHFANDFNFNVNGPVRVEVKVNVDFATSLVTYCKR